MLAIQTHGIPTDRPPLLIVHGLFGSARNWGAIARNLSADRLVLVPDMRNHGHSPWTETHSYADMAGDLAEVIQPFGTADVVGHSMGGKAAMMLALTRPDRVRRLIVADIAPVAYAHSQNHLIAAMRAVELRDLTGRSDADTRLSAGVPDPGVRAFLLQSLDLRSDPRRWRLNLDLLERAMPGITGWPDPQPRDHAGGAVAGLVFAGPTLFLSGGASDYVLPEHRVPIKTLFPAARFAKLTDVGHWLHAEKPREFEASVRAFLT